jgi:hypothetical protein
LTYLAHASHVKIGIVECHRRHVDLAAQNDCVNVDPKYEVELLLRASRIVIDPR